MWPTSDSRFSTLPAPLAGSRDVLVARDSGPARPVPPPQQEADGRDDRPLHSERTNPDGRTGCDVLDRLARFCCPDRHRADAVPPRDFASPPIAVVALPSAGTGPRVETLQAHALAARYLVLPPHWDTADRVLAYAVPGPDPYFHECQPDGASGLPALDMLEMTLSHHDWSRLMLRSEFRAYAQAHGAPAFGGRLGATLRDYHNAYRGCLPLLALARCTLQPQGEPRDWQGDDGDACAERVDEAPVLLLGFAACPRGQPGQHWVMLQRKARTRFEVRDPCTPQGWEQTGVHSMQQAVARVVHALAPREEATGEPPRPADVELLYPRGLVSGFAPARLHGAAPTTPQALVTAL